MTIRDPLSAPTAQPTKDFRQTARWAWRLVWRGKYLILAVMALVLVPTILFLQQATPRYTAAAQIMIEAPGTNDVLSDRSMMFGRPFMSDAIIQTEAELIASSTLARRAVEKLRLDRDPEFNEALREPKPLAAFLASLNPATWIPDSWTERKDEGQRLGPLAREEVERARIVRAFSTRLSVRPQRRSHIIALQFVSEDREKAALITNTLAELYLVDRLEASFDEARQVSRWLGERLETLRRDVVAAENAVEQFRSEHGLRRKTERQVTINDQQLSELNSRLVVARADLAQKQARLEQVRVLVRLRGSVDTSSDVLQSPLIQRLREQEAQKSREMSEALKTYGERHPRMLGLRADLNDLRGKISSEIEKIAASIANDVEVAAAGVHSLERELDGLRQQNNVAGAAEVRLRELERQSDATKSLYEAFLSRFKREAEQERMQRANARIVSPADIPVVPSYPPKRAMLALAALLSLVGGVALVFLIDHLDNAVRSADDAEELTGLPVLAMIPYQRGNADRPAEEVLQRPRSALADGVRSLRTALHLGEGPETPNVVLVTSSVPKEGKTFVSLCLALLFSKVDERVLLIDGDVHRPRLHKALGLEAGRGFAEVLSGKCSFDEALHRGVGGSLDFLPAGHMPEQAEAIQGTQVEALIADLRRRYTRIIIDSPPVLAVADTRVLARLADRVVYLVRWNSTPRDAVRNGMKLLRSAGIGPYGVVLSQVNQRKHAGYGYGDYGQYYGRYRDYYGE
ncbi:GumC family protein [Azospirillum thermophilum]|uniref:Protein tyrosine kinase n=1 Tax=Azospirillum thermophilum TaxID=2202148 RepID=A0A2S2CL13_9PROT|nr:GNVR domain-containing protein [Azospirillum thermophilum]AWK85184.1 protein tyrosine kinase [Azospirillum thermophilum]